MREINQEQIGGEDRIIGQSHMLLITVIHQANMVVKRHHGKFSCFYDKSYTFALKRHGAVVKSQHPDML